MEFFPGLPDGRESIVTQGIYHGLGDFSVGFKATSADTGADGGSNIFRFGAEDLHHGFYRLFGDAKGGATPTGMDGTDGTCGGIPQQNRGAIGGKSHQNCARDIGHQSVTWRDNLSKQAVAPIGFCDHSDNIPVHLFGEHGFLDIKIQSISHDFIVF